MLTNVLLTAALVVAALVALGSLGDRLRRRNRGRHTQWSRRLSLVVVLAALVAVVTGLWWIW